MIEVKRREASISPHFSAEMPSLLQRIYANRGIEDETQLSRGLQDLLHYQLLDGINEAVQLLVDSMAEKRRIVIVGDFDADGATSVALMVSAFRMLGYDHVDYLVPNRFEDGYGLSPEVVSQAAAKGAQLIITVDNGVSSIDGVQAAKALGIKVLVTDHHLPGQALPDADAMVNPNLESCSFPSKVLAGVGVAFYLMLALRAHLREMDWFQQRGIDVPNLAELLDLVALGTVADVVALDMNNRILVHQGLMRIRAGQCRPGIQALIEISKRNIKTLVASDFGFSLGPRLNAAGRLEDMSYGVELLLCDNSSVAHEMAVELDALNQTRREIEQGMKEEALAYCERMKFTDDQSLPSGIALYQADWHQGVIGILASRIKDKFHRPVIAFADGGEGLIKGSARSIQGLHMRDTLDRIDTLHPGLIRKFGGHAMAAGLTIAASDFEKFSAIFDAQVAAIIPQDKLKGILLTDGELMSSELNLEIAESIRQAGPWGQGFQEPLFDGTFRLLDQRLVGEKHLKFMIEPIQGGVAIDAIAFNVDVSAWPDPSVQQVHLVYRLDVNEFRGQRNLQFIVEHLAAV